jgi:hypothetical protein
MRVAIAVWMIAGCGFARGTPPAGAPPDATMALDLDAAPADLHLRIEAWIDGRSNLIIVGSTAHWHNYQYAAPGRELLVNKPTLFDGAAWYPIWPDAPTGENRDCDCDSSNAVLQVSVPAVPSTLTVTPVQARRSITTVQAPTAANNYTLELEFNDTGSGGSATYIASIDVVRI